eukprot:TRINITY_DN11196_c0_g1_i1.p1 TRINITY_DN11196_c0_g1~~TRINITY_DN11196_c0_g1_i1.p1  ORF type:complete len:326 (-),score=105.62 TRINITY_DN11196_c0_g1_i1:28-1005(-)
MKLFKEAKKGLGQATTQGGIETDYLRFKKNGFPHPSEIEEHIEIMRGVRDEVPTLRDRLTSAFNHHKALAESEEKAGAEYNSMREKPMQHATLSQIYKIFGDSKTALASARYELSTTLEEIKEEWKELETKDLQDIRVKQDQANRALTEKLYWEKKDPSASAEAQGRYEIYAGELVTLIHNLRQKKEALVPQYLLRQSMAEVEFSRTLAQIAESQENALRQIGQVHPVPFNGLGGRYAIGSGQVSDFGAPAGHSGPAPVPARPAPTPSNVLQARGLYAFAAQSPQELSFNVGDILTIHSQNGDWWQASLGPNSGLIPGNYVQVIQ